MNRRLFVWSGAAAFAAPSDQIGLGVIGAGGRGAFVMSVFQTDSSVRVRGIADVYEPNLEGALSAASRAQGFAPKAYRQYQQLLADKSIDAVLIATPEHWHHRMVLDALAAGKDVYVEKPLCHTPEQGVELVQAEKHSKQIVQVGMQRRSYDLYIAARQVIANNTLGTVRMIRCWWLNNYLGGKPAERVEGKLDWDQWVGPAGKRPLNPDIFHNWRQYRDFAGGIVSDQGAHVFDGIHMLMAASYPTAVNASGGMPHRPGFDTPESATVIAEYPEEFIATFSINYAAMRYKSRNDQLNQYDGEKARMDIGREDYKVFPQGAEDTPAITKPSEFGFGRATSLHVQNFLECVRTRRTPTAPMRLGFQAALVVQMANLAMERGRRIRWNDAAQRIEGA